MRIDAIRPLPPVAEAKAAGDQGRSFPAPQVATGAPPARPSNVGLLSPSVMLFCNEEPERRRRSEVLLGQEFLKRLDDVRRQLLARRLPRHLLQALSDDMAAAQRPEDAELAGIYDDIALRVAIELARAPADEDNAAPKSAGPAPSVT